MTSAVSNGQLAGRRALITGSTRGIGRDTATLFASEGAAVIVSGRDARRGDQTVEAITADGGTARFVQADLSHLDGVRQLAEEAGDVDVLVNNAAVSVYVPTVEQDAESFELTFAANVRAPYFLVAQLVQKMVARGSGSIINISSFAASIATPGLSVYSATKAALNSLSADVGRGVRCCGCPGERDRFRTRPHRKRDRGHRRGDGRAGRSHHDARPSRHRQRDC